MATNGDFSDEGSQPGSPLLDAHNARGEVEDQEPLEEEKPVKSAMKKPSAPAPQHVRPELPEQPEPSTLDLSKLTPLSPEIICRQATQNIGM
jgi:translation initiation factor 2 subunit 3